MTQSEGLDLPLVDTLLFLRPTESATVFLQQLGRGLRKAKGKSKIRVLDFIGNYKKASLVPFLLGGRKVTSENEATTTYEITKQVGQVGIAELLDQESFFPVGCHIDFEFKVLDIMEKILRAM